MGLQVYRHLWGLEGPLGALLPRIRGEGYDGVEGQAPPVAQQGAYRDQLDALELDLVVQVVTAGSGPAEHLASFRAQLEAAVRLQPVFVNAHAGVDLWPHEVSRSFLREAVRIEQDAGVLVTHETHRGRIMFNPREALHLVPEVPGLSLCADLSHWVNVCERLLSDEEIGITELAPRIRHIHARVGYEQGPQVPDPRAPEYQQHLAAHERWWDAIIAAQRSAGLTRHTLTPEFGPPPYQHTLPYTQAQVADPREISLWMADRQRRRYR